MSQVSTRTFLIRAHEVGQDRVMTIPDLIKVMHEVAWFNAKELGASVYDLHEQGITWALTRFQLQVHQLPLHESEINVSSYPAGNARAFVYRDYHAETLTGQPVATASSTWLVLDLKTRQMSHVRDYMHAITQIPTGRTPVERIRQPLRPVAEPTGSRDFEVRWHELDPNGHVTNITYCTWVLESLPYEHLDQFKLTHIDLQFKAETKLEDQVRASWTFLGPLQIAHQISRLSDGKVLALAKSTWK